MTPLEKAQKEAIIRRIAFAEMELTDLAAFRSIDYETYRKDRLKHILAHQYLDLKWEKLRTFTENAPAAVEEFIRVVNSLIDA